MTNTSNPNLNISYKNTEINKGDLLRAVSVEIIEFGIIYYIEPLQKSVILKELPDIIKKDLILCTQFLSKGENAVLFRTNHYPPQMYKEVKMRGLHKELDLSIYKEGEPIAKIFEVKDF